jgi:hypothetical protein
MVKEEIYDSEINPLMEKIIAICKKHNVSLIADFGLDDDLHVTSALLSGAFTPSHNQLRALDVLKPASRQERKS